jgi:hypothetical protein
LVKFKKLSRAGGSGRMDAVASGRIRGIEGAVRGIEKGLIILAVPWISGRSG